MNIEKFKIISIGTIANYLNLNLSNQKTTACPICGKGNNTPCFKYWVETNTFKCFSCGKGGDSINFVKDVMKMESQGEAMKWIETNIPISTPAFNTPISAPVNHSQDSRKDGRQFSNIYMVFWESLEKDYHYLETRGIDKEIIDRFGIRVVPRNFRPIVLKLIEKFGKPKLQDSGLLVMRNKNHYLHFSRHRLIIPYFDRDGKTILTLQGRNIDSNIDPKYLFLNGINHCLYNLQALKKGHKICLCEGFADVLSIYQLQQVDSLGHPVGLPGVHGFDESYFDLLDGLDVVIATDNDKAGQSFIKDFSKKYYKRFFSVPKVIDWKKIQSTGKDLNELLTQKFEVPEKPRYHSEILNKNYQLTDNGVLFDDQVFYSKHELQHIQDMDDKEVIGIHNLKKIFNGRIK